MSRRQRHWIAAAGLLLGCAPGPRSEPSPFQVEALETIETRFPGVLLVNPDHHMASYDQAMVDPIVLSYRRSSRRLSDAETEKLRAHLREATARELVNLAPSRVVDEPGPCVLRMQTAFVDLELPEPPDDASASTNFVASFGAVTLVHQIVDSETGTLLLRYVGRRRAGGGVVVGGGDSWLRMTKTFDDMLEKLQQNLIESVPHSAATSGPQSACGGLLYRNIEQSRPGWRPRGAD